MQTLPKYSGNGVESAIRQNVEQYLQTVMGANYSLGQASTLAGASSFMVLCAYDGLTRPVAVGAISLDPVTNQVQELTHDQMRNMREAGETQIAQTRGEIARDQDGYILHYHARIQATVWISDRTDLKVGASDGVFLPLERPVWRFSIFYTLGAERLEPLGTIDVDAQTGQVDSLKDSQIEALLGDLRALKQHQPLAAAA